MPISLKPHNVETYQKVTDKLKESNKVAVIHPTGTGKMYIALKMLEENKGKKAIYVAPSNPILHDVKKNIYAEGMTMREFPKIKRITYQKLARLTDVEIQELDADIIVLDEFHHCGAPEWGKGVQRLLQRNEGASVLGLSATPLRYTDGLRDMADELFENNIASEMTLEEAIEREILPEATYVSALYGYDKELEKMQTNIDKIKDNDKRQEAQELLNILRDKLDENTQNLPQLFSEHMQNKSGKYIIFCRNIEDMNEKMGQAQKMFGGVNTNITIRGVSSKIRESDKILTEFEQDNEEGTLKLLYAVDMINEGYHIKDLDGVVMMRPTFSPTIYTQQLGRALTVGGDKKPVVLDLVNNFDSCKIIEDFAEKMRQYKGKEGNEQTEKRKISRFSIFDKTKEFREIAEKITDLSRRRSVTLEQKIEIFEKFLQTGEELVGNTVFEGYPIGRWAIQIRSNINRVNSGKDDDGIIKLNEEQLNILKDLGILESKIGSRIDEKIDSLVEWRRKYPKVKITTIASDEELKEYAKTDDEFKKIQEEYGKMQRYYEYVRYRKYQGALNDEQMKKGKEGNVGGVFGYSTRIEKLAKKYGITEEDMDYIETKYGSVENFYEMHNSGKIEDEKGKKLEEEIIKNNVVDIDGNLNRGYNLLYRAMLGIKSGDIGVNFYSSEELKKQLDILGEKYKLILERRFGLEDGAKPKCYEAIADEMKVTRELIRFYEAKALRRLRANAKKIRYTFEINSEFITDEEREQIEDIKKDIQLQNGDLTGNLEKLKEIEEKRKEKIAKKIINEGIPYGELTDGTFEYLVSIGIDRELANEIILKTQEREEEYKKNKLDISDIGLSVRSYNGLHKAGINTVGDLAILTYEELKKVRNLGIKSYNEIIAKMKEYGISLKEDDEQEKQEKQEKTAKTNNDRSKTESEIELEKNLDNYLEEKEEQQDGIETAIESKVEAESEIEQTKSSEEKEEQHEQELENMTAEQLQGIIKQNEKRIDENEEAIKQALIAKILEQQKTLAKQQERINDIKGQKKEI